ncbi:hypothetical protein [Parabacteroides sp.]
MLSYSVSPPIDRSRKLAGFVRGLPSGKRHCWKRAGEVERDTALEPLLMATILRSPSMEVDWMQVRLLSKSLLFHKRREALFPGRAFKVPPITKRRSVISPSIKTVQMPATSTFTSPVVRFISL